MTGVVVDPALGDIEVQGGIFGVQGFTTLGNASSNLTVFAGATLQFFNVSNVMNKVLVLNNGATVNNNSGANTYGGLTVVAQDTAKIGRTAVELLRARIADPSLPVRTVVVPVSLTVRGSGEVPAPAAAAP